MKIKGNLIESIGKGQSFEVEILDLEILGESDPEKYPIQPKRHSFEFFKRTSSFKDKDSTFSAVMRIRSKLAYGVHKFFNEKGFNYIHTPIITSSDAEGAGEMFQVTTLNNNKIDKKELTILKIFLVKN